MLLIVEVSFSVLLIGAGLLIASLMRLQQIDPGFRSDGVLTASVSLPATRYDDTARVRLFVRELTEQIAAVPGVQAAAVATGIPFGYTGWGKYFTIEGVRRRQPSRKCPPSSTAR
jgi:putative ABC transport system permease protein